MPFANFVFPYICSFLLYLDLKMPVNVKLDVSWRKGLPFKVSDFIVSVFLILNTTGKTKLTIFLYRREIVKKANKLET